MGNRAVIAFDTNAGAPSIYLHWNGGRASVEAFLQAAKHLSIGGAHDGNGFARAHAKCMILDDLAEMIARHFFNCKVGMTVYREPYSGTRGDNGVYLLANDLTIRDRFGATTFEEINAVKTAEIFEHIVQRAPVFND